VRFKEYGVDSIEVQDNGRGIEESDWSAIGEAPTPRSETSSYMLTRWNSAEASYVQAHFFRRPDKRHDTWIPRRSSLLPLRYRQTVPHDLNRHDLTSRYLSHFRT
jgi:hypothetical protein